MIIASILIVAVFILLYRTVEDLHDTVVMSKRYNPEAEIGFIPTLAYNAIQRVRN